MIRVENLTVKFKKFNALDNISLTIQEGEIVALVGQNGAGKSTLLKEIQKLVPNNSGWMPERVLPDPSLTVYEFLSLLSEEGDRIDYVIEHCGLTTNRDKLCGTLSKGTKQRVILALALIGNRDILILDEPSAGLDPLFQKEMIQLIKEVGKGKTIIISTHNIAEIEDLASRIIVLKDGKISYDGDLDSKGAYYEYF